MSSLHIVILLVVVLLIALLAATYNRLVRLRATVQESWSDVDTELRRRHDLIPNLVETVKGYITHEREIMDAVTQAREAAITLSNSPAAQAKHEDTLSHALKSLFAVAENYPNLRASENFNSLQQELANTENRIQAARRFYNANVRENNVAVKSFPSSIVAGCFGFQGAEFFEVDDASVREPVQVSFS